MDRDTIAAISTPIGKSGIGIVRLSGRQALAIADKIFVGTNGLSPSKFPSHSLRYGWIVDSAEKIDEVLLTVMRTPRTYTREDIVEINCHSGIVVLKRILDLLLKSGARLARPGEFTQRAFLNGRIDLTQAEAVLDIVNSQTGSAHQAALGQLQGGLSKKIKQLRQDTLDLLSQIELSIDFSDRDVPLQSEQQLVDRLEKVSGVIKVLLDSAEKGTLLRQGISCAICGKPNVGKSSLLNAFLRRERAIVTPIPGTTRDILEEALDLLGIPLRLIDTAGIIKAKNLVEKEAVKRSKQSIKQADLVLLVLDASKKIDVQDKTVSHAVAKKPLILVLNKNDLPAKISKNQTQKLLPHTKAISISAVRGRGLDRLAKEMAAFIWQGKSAYTAQHVLVTNIRHKQALQRALRCIQRAKKEIKQGKGPEIIALELKQVQRHLGEIIGKISCEDILERIFSQFCIGK